MGGFIVYAAASALVSLLVLHRTGYNTSKYFTSPSALWTEAVGQGLLVPPAPPTHTHSLRLPTVTCSLAPFFSWPSLRGSPTCCSGRTLLPPSSPSHVAAANVVDDLAGSSTASRTSSEELKLPPLSSCSCSCSPAVHLIDAEMRRLGHSQAECWLASRHSVVLLEKQCMVGGCKSGCGGDVVPVVERQEKRQRKEKKVPS